MIGDGCSFPLMYNDDINVPAVQRAFNVSDEEAIHYMPFGCGEYVLNHRSFGTPSGVINLLQALQVTLHKGINPTTGKKMGIPGIEKLEFDSFEMLWETYKQQVEYHVDQLALQEELEYKKAAEIAPHLMFSLLYDDCIDRGKPIFDGGIRYLGGTLETYGNTNTADSFTAIKKLVFEEKRFSLDALVTMMDANFKGYEKERKWMLDAPKYGNDNDYADEMLLEVDNHVFNATRDQRLKTGLHSYLVVNINNNANTVMGGFTAASPDGRAEFTYMANANTPTGGMDKNGITAMMNSIVKPDPGLHAGMVQNMKFSKSMFNENREIVDAVLKTYFEKGGTQCMISVMGREDLELALLEPEKYSNLIVRVGGYSAKWVDLPKDIQAEILSRTMY
jgi:pyruvate-formate lyase